MTVFKRKKLLRRTLVTRDGILYRVICRVTWYPHVESAVGHSAYVETTGKEFVLQSWELEQVEQKVEREFLNRRKDA